MTGPLADQLFTNGMILTQDDDFQRGSQLAVENNRILAIGHDLSTLTDSKTERINLQGSVIVPGFMDAHVHLLWGGESLLTIPLHEATSKASFMELISHFAEAHQAGSWLKGGGWNEHLFTDGSQPSRQWLDNAAPDYPMILHRHDGHSAVASSRALELAGITRTTPNPEGGVIDHDRNGDPTGILRDAAIGLVLSHLPRETEAEHQQNFEAAQQYLLGHGVTSICDMIHDIQHFHFLEKMARLKKLKIRISAYLPLLKWPEIQRILKAGIYEDEHFQFKGLKGFSDGSVGSHTALMLEPYEDTPGSCGIYDADWEDIKRVQTMISEADQSGFQTLVHAIGDRANREVLDMFSVVMNQNGQRDRRFRIEHAQHIHPDDLDRFQELGIIASVQPAHCVDDARYAPQLLGDRCRYAYPFHSLHQAKTTLAFGSDWPVSPADPIATIHGSMRRAGWNMQESLDFRTAIKAHTADAAFAAFRDHDLGKLKAGYLADFVILDPEFLNLESARKPPQYLVRAVYLDGSKV